MTRDERLAQIRQGLNEGKLQWPSCEAIAFLLTELDAATRCYQRWEELYHQRRANEIAADERAARAEARVQRLIDALRGMVEHLCDNQCAESGCPSVRIAVAALTEGEDTQ